MKDDNLQIINQLNEKIQILQSKIAAKNAVIKELGQAINERSNATILPMELSMVIVIPNSDEIDHNRGKVVKIEPNPYYDNYVKFSH